MVSKKEIEDECNAEIAKLQKELETLNEEHKQFAHEDELIRANSAKYCELSEKQEKLALRAYEGNWGSRENWYCSRLPKIYEDNFAHYELDNVKSVLKELHKEKLEQIKESEEYLALDDEMQKLNLIRFRKSARHKEIEDAIDGVEHRIDFNNRRINKIQTKGGLIEVCKILAEQKRAAEDNETGAKQYAECKKLVLDLIAKESASPLETLAGLEQEAQERNGETKDAGC